MEFNRIKDENWDIPEGNPIQIVGLLKIDFTSMGKYRKKIFPPYSSRNVIHAG